MSDNARYPGIGDRRPRLAPAAVVTLTLFIVPALLTWLLVQGGVIDQGWLSISVAAALGVAVCQFGAWWWERRAGSDLLFSDLLPWEWMWRAVSERRLRRAIEVVEAPQASPLTRRRARTALLRVADGLQAADPYTYGHSARVARYAKLIARRLELPAAEAARIQFAASLHDIGKLWTPREIVNKPGKLSEEEFAVIQRHPGDGAEMIAKVLDDPELVAIVRSHHERLDGRGYPDGLTGAEIPLGAQIIAVADTFDAITSRRPYRAARPAKAALDILEGEAGVKLDAEVVAAFRQVYFGRYWPWLPGSLSGASQPLLQSLTEWAKAAAVVGGAAAAGAGASAVAGPALGGVAHRPAAARQHTIISAQPTQSRTVAQLAGTSSGGTGPSTGPTAAGGPAPRGAMPGTAVFGRNGSGRRVSAMPGQPHRGSAPGARSTHSSPSGAARAGSPSSSGAASGASSHGRGNGKGHGNGNGNSHGNGSSHSNGGGNGHGHGNGGGNGHGNGGGNGSGKAIGLGKPTGPVPVTVTAAGGSATVDASGNGSKTPSVTVEPPKPPTPGKGAPDSTAGGPQH